MAGDRFYQWGEPVPRKTVWKLFKILKIDLPYDPAILLLGIYPKNAVTLI